MADFASTIAGKLEELEPLFAVLKRHELVYFLAIVDGVAFRNYAGDLANMTREGENPCLNLPELIPVCLLARCATGCAEASKGG